MDWITKLERKFGKYAIKNLTLYIVSAYVIGYLIMKMAPELYFYLTLEPGYIMKGQVWRLVTWILIPPTGDIISMLFLVLCYYSIGGLLEQTWGAFRYNLYIFCGIIFTIIGAVAVFLLDGGFFGMVGMYFSTYYINLSILLAVAVSYPNLHFYMFGVLPLTAKWLAVIDVALVGYDMIKGGFATRVAIIASLLNFLIFFFSSRNMKPYTPKQMARRTKFKKDVKKPVQTYANGAKHKCAVCGRTELDDPNLEFRYCSKCNGNYEYCQDHLFTHEHIK